MRSHTKRRSVLYGTGTALGMLTAGCLGDEEPTDEPDGSDDGSDGGTEDGGEAETEWSPEGSVRHIIPFGPGGSTDTYGRQIGPALGENLDADWEITNLDGAQSLRGVGELFQSDPDGQTVGSFNLPSTTFAWTMSPSDWDLRNVTAMGGYAFGSSVIISNPDLEIEDFLDLRDRYQDGELENFAAQDRGSRRHLNVQMMRDLWGLDYEQYVAYGGGGEIGQAVISGEVPAAVSTDTGARSIVDSGDVDLVGVIGSQGTEVYPDETPIPDLGDFEPLDWISDSINGLWLPPETPSNIQETYASALEEVLESDPIQEWAEEAGEDFIFMSPEELQDSLTGALDSIEENVDVEGWRDEFY